MGRASQKPAPSAGDKPAAKAEGGATVPAFVRLTGSGTYEGGKLLPVGKSLRVGVEISERLALHRIEAETAEAVLGTAVTAAALRSAAADILIRMREMLATAEARIEAASDAELADAARFDLEASDEARAASETLERAIAAHRDAVEAEAAPAEPQTTE